jgi:hypothetical protein
MDGVAKWGPLVSILLTALVIVIAQIGGPSCSDLQTVAKAEKEHAAMASETQTVKGDVKAVRADVKANHEKVMDKLEALRLEFKEDFRRLRKGRR